MGSTPRVLIADDERVISDTLAAILSKSGFDARTAYGGETAVELARDFQPNILIVDVVMLGMTGIEAAIQVRSMLPSCKVLLFSGQATTADLLEEARTKGYEFDIFAKPFHPKDLLARLENMLLNV